MIPYVTSRFRSTKSQQHFNKFLPFISTINIFHIINSIGGQLLLFYYFLSMSMFYQVMGAIRCPKIKKHAGIKLRPLNKAKDPFVPNDMLIYTCESTEHTQTIKCLDDGRWNEIPSCPDPVNNTCPEPSPVLHGTHNSSGPPYRVGTVLAFKCDNEIVSNLYPMIETTPSTSTATELNLQPHQNISTDSEISPLRYNMTGHRLLKCLPSSKWNHPMPVCAPIVPEPASNASLVLTSVILILIPILIIVTMFHLFMRWRKRKQQQERWKQYFTDYKYRHSKTSITFGMRPSPTTVPSNPVPVTDL